MPRTRTRVWAAASLTLLVSACGSSDSEPRATPTVPATSAATDSARAERRVNEFWNVIEQARSSAEGDVLTMYDALSETLLYLPKVEVVALQQLLAGESRRSYTWAHAAAGELACGYLGDDGFTDFRSWMVAQGRETYDAFVADPDSLADVDGVEDACEGSGEVFASAVAERYEELGGVVGEDEEFPVLELSEALEGRPLSEQEAAERLPRTAEAFGS